MTTHSSILVLKILWTERLGGLESMGVGGAHKRVEINLATKQQQQKQKYKLLKFRGDIKKYYLN